MSEALVGNIWSASYAGVDVYQTTYNGIAVMRRLKDSYVNATQILKCAQYDKLHRTRFLEKEVHTGVHEKIQGGYGKYQGTWVPLSKAIELSKQLDVYLSIKVLFNYDIQNSPKPPPASHSYETSDKRKRRTKTEKPKKPLSSSRSSKTTNQKKISPLNITPTPLPRDILSRQYSANSHFPSDHSSLGYPIQTHTAAGPPNPNYYPPHYYNSYSQYDAKSSSYYREPQYNFHHPYNQPPNTLVPGNSSHGFAPQAPNSDKVFLKYPPIGYFGSGNSIVSPEKSQTHSQSSEQKRGVIRNEPKYDNQVLPHYHPSHPPSHTLDSEETAEGFSVSEKQNKRHKKSDIFITPKHADKRKTVRLKSSYDNHISGNSSSSSLLFSPLHHGGKDDQNAEINKKNLPTTTLETDKPEFTPSATKQSKSKTLDRASDNHQGFPALLAAAEIHLASEERIKAEPAKLKSKTKAISKSFNFGNPEFKGNVFSPGSLQKIKTPLIDKVKLLSQKDSSANADSSVVSTPQKIQKASVSFYSFDSNGPDFKRLYEKYSNSTNSINTAAMNFVNLRNFLIGFSLESIKIADQKNLVLDCGFQPLLPLNLELFVLNDVTYLPSKSLGSGGLTAIHYAARSAHLQTVKLLQSRNLHTSLSKDGRTPLMLSVSSFLCWKYSERNVFPKLLDIFNSTISKRDKNGQTVVHYIAKGANLDYQIIQSYIDHIKKHSELKAPNNLNNKLLKKSYSLAINQKGINPGFLRSSSIIKPSDLNISIEPLASSNQEPDSSRVTSTGSSEKSSTSCVETTAAKFQNKNKTDQLASPSGVELNAFPEVLPSIESYTLENFQERASYYYASCIINHLAETNCSEIIEWKDYSGKRAADIALEKGFKSIHHLLATFKSPEIAKLGDNETQSSFRNFCFVSKTEMNSKTDFFANSEQPGGLPRESNDSISSNTSSNNSQNISLEFADSDLNRKNGIKKGFEAQPDGSLCSLCEAQGASSCSHNSCSSEEVSLDSGSPKFSSNSHEEAIDFDSEPETVMLESSTEESEPELEFDKTQTTSVSREHLIDNELDYYEKNTDQDNTSRNSFVDKLTGISKASFYNDEFENTPLAVRFKLNPKSKEKNIDSDERVKRGSKKSNISYNTNSDEIETKTPTKRGNKKPREVSAPFEHSQTPSLASKHSESVDRTVVRRDTHIDFTPSKFSDIPRKYRFSSESDEKVTTDSQFSSKLYNLDNVPPSKLDSEYLPNFSTSTISTQQPDATLNHPNRHISRDFTPSYSPTILLAKKSKKQHDIQRFGDTKEAPNYKPLLSRNSGLNINTEQISYEISDHMKSLDRYSDEKYQKVLSTDLYEKINKKVSMECSSQISSIYNEHFDTMQSLNKDIEYTCYLLSKFNRDREILTQKLEYLDSKLLHLFESHCQPSLERSSPNTLTNKPLEASADQGLTDGSDSSHLAFSSVIESGSSSELIGVLIEKIRSRASLSKKKLKSSILSSIINSSFALSSKGQDTSSELINSISKQSDLVSVDSMSYSKSNEKIDPSQSSKYDFHDGGNKSISASNSSDQTDFPDNSSAQSPKAKSFSDSSEIEKLSSCINNLYTFISELVDTV
ncbi:hypothetical protein BB560_000726 [Smittium megazygosporum]|uniref:HTH APSES-type domain-containing protein n=1 Tax=Smittium megazygosporum TaxID=133381 RepID=A0A2T9ZJN5_9FUNG|nr:hypothetical protein BB560_000726 [Smittium megazygosporum]